MATRATRSASRAAPTHREPAAITWSDIPFELLLSILHFLDPGLDWPAWRLICRTWRRGLLECAKSPQLWLAAPRPDRTGGWNDRLRLDLAQVVPTPVAEASRLRALALEELDSDDEEEAEVEALDDWPYHWRRHGVELDEYGVCPVDWLEAEATASCRLILKILDARTLIDRHDTLVKPFSFAGTNWLLQVGCEHRTWEGGDGGWRFGVQICHAALRGPHEPDPRHADPTSFCVHKQIPVAIRYRASYTAGGATFHASDFSLQACEQGFRPSSEIGCSFNASGYASDYFPLSVAAFATGPASPDLHISIDIEHLAYGKWAW